MRMEKLRDCKENMPWCGISGGNITYEHAPKTTFQLQCRKKPTKDIQHYTRTYEPKKVERYEDRAVYPRVLNRIAIGLLQFPWIQTRITGVRD